MAQIIPEDSLTTSFPGTELHDAIRQLPSDFKAWQQLSADILTSGLRYWVTSDNRSILIATLPEGVFALDRPLNKTQLQHQPLVFELIQERDALLPEMLRQHASQLLPIVLLLPDNLDEKQTIYLKSRGLLAIGSILLDGGMHSVISRCLGITASAHVLNILQSRFNPEFVVHQAIDDSGFKSSAPVILDQQQQQAMTVALTDTNHTLQAFSMRKVQGLAGSGKSTILAKRARLTAQRHPTDKVLVLSHNKAVSNHLKHEIGELSNVQCHPFMEWCRKFLGGTRRFVYEDQETELFDLMIKRHFDDSVLSRYGLMHEVNFIKDNLITTEAEYLNTLRSSQSLPLTTPVRKKVWQATVQIDTHLRGRNCHLWADAPAFLLNDIRDGKTFEPLKFVLIDEAQFFAPAWIKVLQCAMDDNAQLFLTSDRDQNFYNRTLERQVTGLDFRDRRLTLERSYRCNSGIARVVDNFRLHRSMKPLTAPLYSINQLEPIPPEDCPQLFHFPTADDQKTRLFSEIHQLLKRGFSPQDILIVTADKQSTRFLAQDIRQALVISTTTLTGSMTLNDESLKLCDIETVTGLESKVVFITGLEEIFDPESDPAVSQRERQSLKLSNTHLLHMAMTRASERLFMMITANRVPDELMVEGMNIPTYSSARRAAVRYINQ